MKTRVEGLPVTVEAGGTIQMTFDRIEGDTVVYRVVVPETPEPEPDFTYLLAKVNKSDVGFVTGYLEALDGVLEVTEHPGDCCCSNCPWDGSHSGPVGQRTWREC